MVAVIDVEYVAFGQPDKAKAKKFFTDFGLVTEAESDRETLFRGRSSNRYCYVAIHSEKPGVHAVAMRVADRSVLEEATRFPEASDIEAIERPGGGFRVRLPSPDGIPFELVSDIEPVAPMPLREALTFNHADVKRRRGSWQRPPLEAAEVLRLGHVAIRTANFGPNAEWLQSRFDMRPSDLLFDGNEANRIGGFFHCTGGKDWTDHHTVALFPSNNSRVHHISFEVQDLDAQFLGNKYLRSQGWNPLWGIGRHILGSQIFDYWFDPTGNVVEHFTDGDLVTPGHKPELHQVSDDSLAQWGPPMPVENFIDTKAVGG